VGQIPTFDEYLRLKGFGHIWRKFRRTGPIMKFTARQIREHNAVGDSSRPDFLTRFIQAREKYPEVMTDGRLATYTNTNVSAGSDTTAIALRQILFKLLTHPGAKDRFLSELATVLRAREEKGGVRPEVPVTWAEGQSMTYYQALIKECLRTHPPLGQLIPRVVPEGGTELCGKYLPGGTVVGCNAWVVHRDKKVFGADADEFRPERWLEEGPEGEEKRRQMENLSFAFGGGPRVCLGKNIALLEISKMVPELFRRYEVAIVDPSNYRLVPGWLVAQAGLDVTLKKREGDWWVTNGVKG
jgi:cytochrome P450